MVGRKGKAADLIPEADKHPSDEENPLLQSC